MSAVLTLIQGDAEQPFIQHPITTVREACLGAAEQLKRGTAVERQWAARFDRFAMALSKGYVWELSQVPFQRCQTAQDRYNREERQHRAWLRLTDAARQEVILAALGDDVMAGKNLAARISETTEYKTYPDELRDLIRKISYLGGIAKRKVPRIEGGTAWKWAYARGARALQDQFDQEGGA